MPVIIDFYADWCGPCRQLSPRIEEIAKEYAGKIIVYKVNTDKERELSQKLGIQSLPTLLFIPMKGQPQATMGALPKETLVKAVNEVLLVK
jgi:thioredoxin 1